MGVAVHREGPLRRNVSVNKTRWHIKCFRRSEGFDSIKPLSSEYGMIWWHDIIPVSSVHRLTAATHKIQQATAETCVKQRALCTHEMPVRLSFHSAKYVVSGRPQQVSWYPKTQTHKLCYIRSVTDQQTSSAYTCWVWTPGRMSTSSRIADCSVVFHGVHTTKRESCEMFGDGNVLFEKTTWLAERTFWRLFWGFYVAW